MGSLQRFEQRLEHMVTGAFARTFRSAVQPVEISAALRREVDNSAQIMSRDHRLAPNDFTIDLAPSDFDRLSGFGDTLSRELADMLHQHAADAHYVFVGPVRLSFQRIDDLTTGRFRVRSQATAAVNSEKPLQQPAVANAPAPVMLEVNGGRHPIEPPGVVIGRGSAATLRISDPGISRRHAEFHVAAGPTGPTVTVVDLGSTNGTAVNGERVTQTRLGDGDRVQIGSTEIVVRLPRATPGVAAPQAGSIQPPPWGG